MIKRIARWILRKELDDLRLKALIDKGTIRNLRNDKEQLIRDLHLTWVGPEAARRAQQTPRQSIE